MSAKKYRLFAMPTDSEGVKCAAENKYSRITPKYVLVYKSGRKPTNGVEVKSDELKCLTEADEQWLFESNLKIIAEEAKTKKPETAKRLNEMIAELERALEEERLGGVMHDEST